MLLIRPVAAFGVAIKAPLDKLRKALPGAFFASRPVLPHVSRPIGVPGLKLPILQPVAFDPCNARQTPGSRKRKLRTRFLPCCPEERREDAERSAIARPDVFGLMQKAASENANPNAALAQLGGDGLVDPFGAAVAPCPEDAASTAFSGKSRKHGQGMASLQAQCKPQRFEPLCMLAQRSCEPPAGGCAWSPIIGFVGFKDIKRDDRAAALCCRMERRMIRDAKIVTKPENKGRCRHHEDGGDSFKDNARA